MTRRELALGLPLPESTAARRLSRGVSRSIGVSELNPRGPDRLTERPAHNIEHLFDVAVGVALFGGRSHASLDVVLEDQQGDRIHCRSEGRGLLEDVDAVLTPLDHALDASHLAFDAAEPPDQGRLVPRVGLAKSLSLIHI